MDVLVMLEERQDQELALAQIGAVPSPLTAESPDRPVVTMYGEASPANLAHALAAVVSGHSGAVTANDAFVAQGPVLLESNGGAIRQLAAGLTQAEWPEGAIRGLTVRLPASARSSGGVALQSEALLESLRELDGLTVEYEEE
jgi:hypothetical protein